MAARCSVEQCSNRRLYMCYCCQNDFCLSHVNDHKSSEDAKLFDLERSIQEYSKQISLITAQEINNSLRQKLDKWRSKWHDDINIAFENACRMFEQNIDEEMNRQKRKLEGVRQDKDLIERCQSVTDEEIQRLKDYMDCINQEVAEFKSNFVRRIVDPLLKNDRILKLTNPGNMSDRLSKIPPTQSIKWKDGWRSPRINCSDQRLLIGSENSLVLYDESLSFIKEHQLNEPVSSIVWASALKGFFIVTNENVYLADEDLTSCRTVLTNQQEHWDISACSKESLFLSNTKNSFIDEYALLPFVTLKKRWNTPHTCSNGENILHIACSDDKLGLIIFNESTKKSRLEVKLVADFQHQWSVTFLSKSIRPIVNCCPFGFDEWFIMDESHSKVLYIKRGDIANYVDSLKYRYGAWLGKNKFVATTSDSVRFENVY